MSFISLLGVELKKNPPFGYFHYFVCSGSFYVASRNISRGRKF